jgi:hypothetical protein
VLRKEAAVITEVVLMDLSHYLKRKTAVDGNWLKFLEVERCQEDGIGSMVISAFLF